MEKNDPLKDLVLAQEAAALESQNQIKVKVTAKTRRSKTDPSRKATVGWGIGACVVVAALVIGVGMLMKGSKPATTKAKADETAQAKVEPAKVEPPKVEPPKAQPTAVPPKAPPVKVEQPKAPPAKVEPQKVEETEPEGLSTDTETDVTKLYRGKISGGVLTLDKGKVKLSKYVRLMKAYVNKKADKTVVMFFLTEPQQEVQFEGVSLAVWYQLTDQPGKHYKVEGNKTQSFQKRGILSIEIKE